MCDLTCGCRCENTVVHSTEAGQGQSVSRAFDRGELGSVRTHDAMVSFRMERSVLRAKIDMASPNINMRDPVIYRVARYASVDNAGDKWCIIDPMYDFAHPIEDAIEGVTRSICHAGIRRSLDRRITG